MVVHSEVLAAYTLRPTSTVQDPAAPRNYPHSGLPPDNSAQNRILQRSVVNRMLLRDHTGPKGNSSSTVYKTVVSGCGPRTAAHQAGGQPITQRASCCLHRRSEHHPTAAYPHFPVPKIAALPRVHPPKLPMYSQSRAAV